MSVESAANSLASAADPSGDGDSTPVAAAKLTTRVSLSWSRPNMPASLHQKKQKLI